VQQAQQVYKVLLVQPGTVDILVIQDQLVQPVQQVTLEILVTLVILVQQVRQAQQVYLGFVVIPDLLEVQALLDLLVAQDYKVL
jgi:hypothetical protein